MQIQPNVSYLPDAVLEAHASRLIGRYGQAYGALSQFPVPVERIADLLLELDLLWEPIPDTLETWTLAYLDPAIRRIGLNETHQAHFDTFFGTYEFTVAHEIGHFELHLLDAELVPMPFAAQTGEVRRGYLCRSQGRAANPARPYDRRELQANRFASFLLLPEDLLRPAVRGLDLTRRPDLDQLRRLCHVSLEALKIRLQGLGWLYIAPDGALHHSEGETQGQRRFF